VRWGPGGNRVLNIQNGRQKDLQQNNTILVKELEKK